MASAIFTRRRRCAVVMVCGQDRDGKSALKIEGVNSPATALSLSWHGVKAVERMEKIKGLTKF